MTSDTSRDRLHFPFFNRGYFLDHVFMLIFATIAALRLAGQAGHELRGSPGSRSASTRTAGPPAWSLMEALRSSRRVPPWALVAALCLPLTCIPKAAAAQDERDGFYAGLQLGVGFPTTVQSARSYISHPTRCDVLLYPSSVSPPIEDPACLDDSPVVTSTRFDPGAGLAAGFMLGYAVSGLRFEVEYVNASPANVVTPIGETTSTALRDKTSEWSTDEPPYEWIGDYTVRQAFANVYYDFRNGSRWTPYAGTGVGWAAVDLNYYLQLVRKPAAEYLQIEFDPDWPNAAKRTAAGTVSILDTYASQIVFGYEALAGVDYALSEHTSLGVTLRWARFGDVEHDALHNIVRSHAPVLADGVTPWNNELAFSGIGYRGLTVNLKYHF